MDYIIIAILAGIVIMAILRSIKHFKGGGCCGSGQLSFRLAPYTKHWEATDFSENMIAEAKKNVRPRNLFFFCKGCN